MSLTAGPLTAQMLIDRLPKMVRKTADETNATTTIQSDDELLLALDASSSYRVKLIAVVNAPAATDMKMEWTTPVGVSGYWTLKNRSLVGAADTVYQGSLGWATQGQIEGSASDIVVEIFGVIVTTAAGTLTYRWAAQAAGTVAVKTNSYLEVLKFM
jgi:hypothetical protein